MDDPPKKTATTASRFHALVTSLLLLLGGTLVLVAIWLSMGGAASLRLSIAGAALPFFAHRAFMASIALGSLMVLAGVVSLWGRTGSLRPLYILMATGIVVGLMLVAGSALSVGFRRGKLVNQVAGADVWRRAVAERPRAVCRVERRLECRGFRDRFCWRERCAECGGRKGGVERACVEAFASDRRILSVPVVIGSIVVGGLLLADVHWVR